MKLLHNIIKEVADAMKLPCVAIYANGKGGINIELDEEAARHGQVLMFELLQSPTLSVTGTRYGYLEYKAVLMFLAYDNDSTDEQTRALIDAQVQKAFEFFAYLRENESWARHFENNASDLRVPLQEVMDVFDSCVSGVMATLTAKFDPQFNLDNLCP